MNITRIMSAPVVMIDMDDDLRAVKDIFDHTKFHHLLVVDGGKVCGVVSDRDLLKALSPYIGTAVESSRDVATLHKKVHQIMTRKPVTVLANASVASVIEIFQQRSFSCVPVVDVDQKPVGIITWRDVIKLLAIDHDKNSFNAYQDGQH